MEKQEWLKEKYNTFEELFDDVEDFKLGKIMEKNDGNSYDISLLKKRFGFCR